MTQFSIRWILSLNRLSQNRGPVQTFARESTGAYLSNTSYFLPEAPDLWLAVLNSGVANYYAKNIFVEKQGGWYEVQPEALKRFPIPHATKSQRETVELLTNAVVTAQSLSHVAPYLERLLNGLVYELFFSDELHASKLRFFSHLEATPPPNLKSVPKSQRIAYLQEFHAKISDLNHALYADLFALNGIETVRIIEGRDQD